MTASPPLPDGITPADRCAVSGALRTPHRPHLWAWHPHPTRQHEQIYPEEGTPLPPDAEQRWCDGGVPGGTR